MSKTTRIAAAAVGELLNRGEVALVQWLLGQDNSRITRAFLLAEWENMWQGRSVYLAMLHQCHEDVERSIRCSLMR
jgi:hypothetical protein